MSGGGGVGEAACASGKGLVEDCGVSGIGAGDDPGDELAEAGVGAESLKLEE